MSDPQPRYTRVLSAVPAPLQKLLNLELFKYTVSGVIAFICDFSVLILMTEGLGIHYLVSNVGGYFVGLLVSYQLNIRYVFRHRRYKHQQSREFTYFTLIVIAGLFVSELALYVITEGLAVHYTVAKFISAVFVFLFNYTVKKFLLFRA